MTDSKDKSEEADDKDASEQESSNGGSSKSDSSDSAFQEDPAPTVLVWAARLVTLGALAIIIGYLVHLIFTDERPAQFVIDAQYDQLDQRNGNYVLPIRLTNDSTEAVTSVVLDAELDLPGDETTNLSATLPLMGEGESAMLEMVFQTRPTPDTLDLRVSSYQSP